MSIAGAAKPPLTQLQQPRPRSIARRKWAFWTFALSLAAVALEMSTHICASAFVDPLPNLSSIAACLLVLCLVPINEWILDPVRDDDRGVGRLLGRLRLFQDERRLVGAAFAFSCVGLLIAAMYTFMLAVLLPFAVVLLLTIFLTIIGALMVTPLMNVVVLSYQIAALRCRYRELSPELGRLPARVTVPTALLVVTAAFFLIVRPLFIGVLLERSLRYDGPTQEHAFDALRFLRGESALLDRAYRNKPPFWVCLGHNGPEHGWWPWNGYEWHWEDRDQDVKKARRAWYLMTGRGFETAPAPVSARREGGLFGGSTNAAIEETGGEVVGRRVEGLSLAESRLTGTLDPKTETAVCDWVMVFKNDTSEAQEARAEIYLPEGGVVHQVSLWINGEERPAAFGAPGRVRAAYQEIAVVQRRDPLLVTMPAPGKILAQCFPVPAMGKMKIRLGITAPLVWQSPRWTFTLPALGPINFDVPRSFRQHISIDVKGKVVPYPVDSLDSLRYLSPTPSLQLAFSENGQQSTWERSVASNRFTAEFPRSHLTVPLTVSIHNKPGPWAGDRLAEGVIRAASPFPRARRPVDLFVLVDATEGMDGWLGNERWWRMTNAIADLPPGSRVRFADTRTFDRVATGWQDAHSIFGGSKPIRYAGGVDPMPALCWAWDETLRRGSNNEAAIIWLHGPSPVGISDPAPLKRRLASVVGAGPVLIGVPVAPQAPDALMTALAQTHPVYSTRPVPPGDGEALASVITRAAIATEAHGTTIAPGGRLPPWNELATVSSAARSRGDAHSRLSAYGDVLAALYTGGEDEHIAAGQEAARRRLVTPLSGAVVLETREQYERHGLSDGTEAKSKTGKEGAKKQKWDNSSFVSPEPSTLALFGAVGAVGVVSLLRRWLTR